MKHFTFSLHSTKGVLTLLYKEERMKRMMKRWRKASAFVLCMVLMAGMLSEMPAGRIVNAQEIQNSEDTKKASGNASGDASGDSDETYTWTTSMDAAVKEESVFTKEAANRFSIQQVQYDYSKVTAGQEQKIRLYAATVLSEIQDEQLKLTFTCDQDGSTMTAEMRYSRQMERFEGSLAITNSMMPGVYRITQVEYISAVNQERVAFSVTDSQLATFEKTDAASQKVKVQKIVLSAKSITMNEGATRTLSASVVPENVENASINWSSSNTKLATVNGKGVVTARKKGTVTITAEAMDGSGVVATCKVKIQENLVIVLDPGHGASDVGAVNRSQKLYERNINLQIAKACRNYLEQYEGVTVFLTRETNQGFLGLEGRAKFAKTCDADVLISLHINASGYRGVKGSEVWVTRSTYKPGYNKAMKALGKKILNNLGKCGFQKRGVFTRKSAYLRYPFDGKIADYYGVIRESIYRDIPAMIVEHGYIDSSDYKLMNTNAKAKKLGVADAKAIAEYYGLKKRTDNKNPILVSGIKLNCNESTLSINKGKSYSLKATVAPTNAANKKVTYTSSKPSVVSVNSSGKLKAKKKGTATIQCRAKDESGTTRTLKVTVK